MKLRIHDGTFRFRITGEEHDQLREAGSIRSENKVPGTSGGAQTFIFKILRETGETPTRLELEPYGVTLRLSPTDFNKLLEPDREGIYVEKQWTDDQGSESYFLAFVEKDRKP